MEYWEYVPVVSCGRLILDNERLVPIILISTAHYLRDSIVDQFKLVHDILESGL